MDWTSMNRAAILSVPERLSVDLERLILEGKIKPGDKLPPERELAEHLEASRVSIREALRELEARGLIDRKPGRGTIVLSPGERSGLLDATERAMKALQPELHDIMELRTIVEPPIARIAASRATERDVTQLRELVEEMEKGAPKKRYAELDRAFHQAIAQYAHNPLLELINAQIAQQIEPSRADRYQTKRRQYVSSAAHRRIYEAIAAGDGDLAEREAREHVFTVKQEIALTANVNRGP